MPFDRVVYAMGTLLSLHLVGLRAVVEPASEKAVQEVARIEAACSTWRKDSDWSRLNQARGAPVSLAPEWLELLTTAQRWQRETEGAFDPVLGALLDAWGIRDGGRTPTAAALARARHASGAQLLRVDVGHGTAQLLSPEARVEEGGFVKGYALDRARAVLEAAGVHAGLLDFGGQLLAWGAPRRVEVADPMRRHEARVALTLAGASLSTSGPSEHGRHILDPRTGEPSPAWGSVSVVAKDGLTADILSTALYVLGPERGLAWAESHHVAAVFQRQGARPTLSSALKDLSPRILSTESQATP